MILLTSESWITSILGVKLWDTENAGRAILPMVGPQTTVLSLQNGVESDDILESFVGAEPIIGGVAFIASSIGEPGVIKPYRHHATCRRRRTTRWLVCTGQGAA